MPRKSKIPHDGVPARDCDTRQEHFLKKAALVATRSCMNHRHGCLIVNRNGEVLAEGYNSVNMHMCHMYSVHAEVSCLNKVKKNKRLLNDCEMYVVRIGTDNMGCPLKYSRPCPECTKAIVKSGIKKIYYSTSEEFCMKLEKVSFIQENV